jgi:site-specific DNA-methyltransferase (adenine-specific)
MLGTVAVNSVTCCDALEFMARLPDNSINLIAVDWPYNGVKDEEWDNQWATDSDYLAWMKIHLLEMRRVLKANGSYYGFASPRMAARVEVMTGEVFNVVNGITWKKTGQSYAEMYGVEKFRGFVEMSERIIFAEQYGSENSFTTQSEIIWGATFKSLQEWFRNQIDIFGITNKSINTAVGTANSGGGMASHYFGETFQFALPTADMYSKMQTAFPQAFNRSYDDLRREYDDLRREYDDLRRPFNVSADVPYTDVWDFATVGTYPGKHPCEKPLAMMQHIISASSRPGNVVLDCFCGSGNTLAAAKSLGRGYIGCDRDSHWTQVASNKLVTEFGQRRKQYSPINDLPMFAQLAG